MITVIKLKLKRGQRNLVLHPIKIEVVNALNAKYEDASALGPPEWVNVPLSCICRDVASAQCRSLLRAGKSRNDWRQGIQAWKNRPGNKARRSSENMSFVSVGTPRCVPKVLQHAAEIHQDIMATSKETSIIIITGGASGIGLAMTRHFASQGHHIAVLDVNADEGPAIVAGLAKEYPESTLLFEKCDVSVWHDQAASFKKIFDRFRRIDIVMANAGISERGQSDMVVLDSEEPSQPRLAAINVNFIGVLNSISFQRVESSCHS